MVFTCREIFDQSARALSSVGGVSHGRVTRGVPGGNEKFSHDGSCEKALRANLKVDLDSVGNH